MSQQFEFFRSIENVTEAVSTGVSVAFEGFVEAVLGAPQSLRDGSETDPVELPRDLYAHENAQTEWWYYTGHADTASGKRFGFELVFFKRRTDLDKFSVVPLRVFGNPIYFAHFALTDVNEKQFRYSHRKSSNGLLDLPASAGTEQYYLRLGDWSVREAGKSHVLSASMGSNIFFDATLTPAKPVILNGSKMNGVSFKDEGEASRYFSYTRMALEGDIEIDGKVEHFTGTAWMDREFGTWLPTEKQKGWDWFSVQLDDGSELMAYQLRDGDGNSSEYSSGVYVPSDSKQIPLSSGDFRIVPIGFWKSPGSGATYPSGWKLQVESLDIDLTVAPVLQDQELDSRGTTMIVYWEGACSVIGKSAGVAVKGDAYVELVGYDRSHDNPNLAYFLAGSSFESGT